MVFCSRLYMIDVQTFHMTSTIPMSLYPPLPFDMITIVVYVISNGVYPSRNTTCIILTKLSHFSVYISFSMVASRIHVFKCSDFSPDSPPALPARNFRTAASKPSPSGVPSAILTSCTNII